MRGYYNVGPDDCDCVTTGTLVDLFCRAWGGDAAWENQAEANAPHEANFLKLDCSKLKTTFGWTPRWHMAECMEKTVAFSKIWLANGDVPAEMEKEINIFLEEQIIMWKNEAEAREQIKAMVAEYYHDFKEKKTPYQEGDRITYAARVFDEKEMCALTDATLDFWLTTGRFADRFEKEFAKWIGVKFAHLVNSGSSANLIAFMALTAPRAG